MHTLISRAEQALQCTHSLWDYQGSSAVEWHTRARAVLSYSFTVSGTNSHLSTFLPKPSNTHVSPFIFLSQQVTKSKPVPSSNNSPFLSPGAQRPGKGGSPLPPQADLFAATVDLVLANPTSSFGVPDCCEPLCSLSVSNVSHFLPANYQRNRL